jgi:peroxiredoxin
MKFGSKILLTLLFMLLALPHLVVADMVGVEAADFSLNDLEGNAISLSQFSGKIVALFHFNVYCHTCQEEVPLINRIYQENEDLQVIGIAIGSDIQEALDFKNNYQAEFLVVPDPQKELFEEYHVNSVPLVDIIDKTGTIRYRGKINDYGEFTSIIEEMAQEKEVVGVNLWNNPPNFTLMDTEGNSSQLYDIIGEKTILLTFFSVRDATVRQIIEIMKALYNRYRRQDLELIRIAVKDTVEEIKNFREKYYVTFPILVDEQGEVAQLYNISDLPRAFIINKKGKIRYSSDQISLDNIESVLVKVKSYFKEEPPEEILRQHLDAVAPGVLKFYRVNLEEDQVVYIGDTKTHEKVLVRKVFKDVLCDTCNNVHFLYSFDLDGKIKNIQLIEYIDIHGVAVEADDFLKRVIKKANKKMPLRFRKDIDGISGATQTSKLIIEGINETPEIINSLNTYRDIFMQITH